MNHAKPMQDESTPLPRQLEEAERRRPRLWELWAAILVSSVVVGGGVEFVWPAPSGDRIPSDTQAQRLQIFGTLTPIPVVPLPDDEEKRAINSMGLSAPEKDLLLATLRAERAAQSTAVTNPTPGAVSSSQPHASSDTPLTEIKATERPTAKPRTKPARPIALTQITLWDTDVADGDVVRIVSSGYETEVQLAKSPITLAVPIPPRGVINIVGVRDGGGGITAGITVGGRAVDLPIMSAGQTLGVPVLVRR
jgi:hypothetical protein